MLFTFLRDPAGFDKVLRLAQSVSLVTMTYSISTASQFRRVKDQCAYVRRVTRMFNWIDCTRLIQTHNAKGVSTSVASVLFNVKWTMMAMYLLVEMCALPWQSQIWTTPTGQTIDTEANKFWAYALTAAVAGDIWDILTATPTSENAKVGGRSKTAQDPSEKKQEAKKQGLEKRDEKKRDWRLYRQLVVDGCDLFIPLTIVGWVDLGSRRLGALMVVSTLGAGWGVYERLSR